ncbi:MAG: NfeD family protein [Cyanobacteria bacterium P01_G01_bin.54]
MNGTDDHRIKILFLASDPSDTTRLRLGQELRDIREKLQLSKNRDRFVLESRESVRPGDITQAIFDIEPSIVHFSGHGSNTDELCFEDVLGNVQVVNPSALAQLFELVSDRINYVVLNACYPAIQAEAISKHIPFVVGMNDAIGDKAAIAFATGFYKALGASHSIEKAYKFGRAEIGIEGIPESVAPVLYFQESSKTKESKAIWLVEFKATLENLDEQELEAIVNSLRQITGDASLSLQKVESGSVKLFLEGSIAALQRIQSLVEEGKLKEVVGVPIKKVNADTMGIMEGKISNDKVGTVKFMGSWWTAKCASANVTIEPGEKVVVVGRQGITLLVVPLSD